MKRGIATLTACLGAVALFGGCSDSSSQQGPGASVSVVERDFKIQAPREVDSGEVRLSIDNEGPDAHEFIVVRSDGAPLPLRKDGLTMDEDKVEDRIVAALEPGLPGTREVDASLTPGRYVLLCNMSGHLMGGMKRTLVVG
jgi:uncharacterized cupredoxin-like copper-binding protein